MSEPTAEEAPPETKITEEVPAGPPEEQEQVPIEVEEPAPAPAVSTKHVVVAEPERRNTINDDSRDASATEESVVHDLKKNKVVKIELPPPMSTRQLLMLGVFILLECFHALLTLSLGPIAPATVKAYHLGGYFSTSLSSIPVIACLLGYYPTFKVITAFGMKHGLALCLVFSLVGTILCYFIDVDASFFLVGQLMIMLGMQSLHTAKGLFVNLYFPEKNVRLPLLREEEP